MIAPAITVLPEDAAKDPADFRTLRYAVRYDPISGGGFVFINNHLRRRKLAYHPDVTLTLDTGHGTVSTPPVNIRDHDIRILPYNLPLEAGCVLTASNATPLCRIGSRWFFYTDDAPVYRFAGKEAEIITLTNAESLHAFLLGNQLYVTDRDDCLLYEQDGKVVAEFYTDTHIRVWSATGDSRELLLTAPEAEGHCTVTAVEENLWELNLTYPDTTAAPMLTVDFWGITRKFSTHGNRTSSLRTGSPPDFRSSSHWGSMGSRNRYGSYAFVGKYRLDGLPSLFEADGDGAETLGIDLADEIPMLV